jgi:hypothetical protein
MTLSSTPEYAINLVAFFIIAVSAYNVGYLHAQDKHQTTTKFLCHEEVVYKWTGSYWDKLGQSCKTEAQMKGMT